VRSLRQVRRIRIERGQLGSQIIHVGRAVAVAIFPGTQISNLWLHPQELRFYFYDLFSPEKIAHHGILVHSSSIVFFFSRCSCTELGVALDVGEG
jgi:hypothetical protein